MIRRLGHGGRRGAQRVCRRLVRRVHNAPDGGFILLESIIAIAVIVIVMSAVTVEFVGTVSGTSRLRTQQGAVQVANSTVDQIRALHASDLVTGRDSSDVQNQFNLAPSVVKPWLYSLSDQATDPKAVAPTGISAAVPTAVTQQKPSTVAYSVYQYLQRCAVPKTAGTGCIAQSSIGVTPATVYLQAVVAVTWPSGNCGSSQCAYVTSTLVSAAADPTFRINAAPYAAPLIVDPGALTNAVNDQVALQLKLATGTGVPSFTWAVASGALPPGLSMNGSGLISGTISGAAGSYTATVQVLDQFQRTDTQAMTWTVEPAVVVGTIANQVNLVGSKASVQVTASGGGGSGFTFSDPNSTLPAGLTISPAGLISGTLTVPAPRVYTVSITATDPQTCQNCTTSTRTATTSFQWSVNYPPLATTVPANQKSTIGNTLTAARVVTMTATGGDGVYVWSATGLPDGLAINPTTGTISGTPTRTGTFSATVTLSDPTAGVTPSTTSFTWTVYAAPTITTVPSQKNTLGASVSLNTQPSCPNAPCTYSLTGAPTNLTISSTGVITGTIGGAPGTTSTTVTVTDSAGATATATFAWTVYAAPSITALSAASVTTGVAYSTAVTYTCAYPSCTITLSGSVPGIGLTTTSGSTADNTAATSLTVSSGSGTVYLSGTVKSTAVSVGAGSAAYSPRLSITSQDNVTPAVTVPTWTAYAQPSLGALATDTASETAVDSVPVTYTCPNAHCTIQLAGSIPGLGLSTSASKAGDNSAATSLAVTTTSGTVYITGTVQNTAVTGTATSKNYSPSVTITDGGPFTSAPTTAAWTAYIAPTLTSPGAQTNDIGDVVGPIDLAATCADGPCTYTWTLPTGLAVANGVISGTIAANAATGPMSASVTVTDADGAVASTGGFTWTVYAKPSVTGLVTRNVTEGATYTGANSTAIGYTCPRVTCTVSLGNGVPGIGVSLTNSGAAAGSVTVSATSGTVYLLGTVGAAAVTGSATSQAYNQSVSITDGGSITSSASATWTAYVAPTVGSLPDPRAVSVGAVDSVPVTYHCPNGTCTLTLSGSVPGLGLSTSANQSTNNTTTSLAVTAASGTVYLTGTVQSTALNSGASKVWKPSVIITDNGQYTSPASSATWTAYPAPTATSLPAKSVTVGTVDNTPIAYSCPTKACVLTLAGAYPGVGLSTGANQAGDNSAATSLTLAATTGTVYITGTVQSSAVRTGATSQTYTPTLTLTDGGSYSSTSTNSWVASVRLSVTSPGDQVDSVGSVVSIPLTTTCSNPTCRYTFVGTAPTGLSITNAGTITGTIGGSPRSYTGLAVKVTDSLNNSVTSATFTWTVNTAPTMGNPGNQTTGRGARVSLDVSPLAANGTGNYTFSASGLPAWLSINAGTGVISGTAPSVNSTTTNIQVTVTDDSGVSATSAAFTWNVTNLANSFGTLTSPDNSGVSLDLDNYTTGGTGPYTYRVTNLPSWLTLNPVTNVLSGTSPNLFNASRAYSGVQITVTDSKGATVTTGSFTWYVSDMAWSLPSPLTTPVGTNMSGYNASTYLAGGATGKTYTAANLPPGVTINSNGALSGSTTTRGTYNTTITATDSVGASVTGSITWTVS